MAQGKAYHGLELYFSMFRFELRSLISGLVFVVPAALLLTACLQGAQLDNETEIKETLGCDIEKLFKTCDGTGCHETHAGAAPAGGVVFFPPEVRGSLVGMPAIYPPYVTYTYEDYGPCPTADRELIIDPVNPDASLFLKKLNKTQICGRMMPDGRKQLSANEIECFRQWVLETIAEATPAGSGGGT